MKRLHLNLFVIAATLFGLSVPLFSASEEVIVGSKSIHVPKGFDSNDNTEVMITGELPNTCHLRPYGDAKIDGNTIKIDVKATKVSGENVVCIMAVVPYMISVPLGQLDQGSYSIDVNPGTDTEQGGNLVIEQANSNSIDNFTYANVTSVKKHPGTNTFAIQGLHPSSCMELDRVEIVSNDSANTFAVLPIIKQTKPVCDRMVKPFAWNLELPNVRKKNVVVHVRKIDGTAINYLVKKQR